MVANCVRTPDQAVTRTEAISIDSIDLVSIARKKTEHESVAELASSINEVGLLHLPAVTPSPDGRYRLVFGMRRVCAAVHLGWKEIPVHIIGDGDIGLISLVENLQRKNPSIPDIAGAVKSIVEEGRLTVSHIGRAIGKSKSWVSKTAKLGTIIEQWQPRGVSFTKLSQSTYYELLDSPELLVMAEDYNWTQSRARTMAKRHQSGDKYRSALQRSKHPKPDCGIPTEVDTYSPVTHTDHGFIVQPFVFDKSAHQDIDAVIEKLQELQSQVEGLIVVLRQHQASAP